MTATPPTPPPIPTPAGRANTAAIISVIAGMACLVTLLWVNLIVGGALALIALVAGNIGIGEARKGNGGMPIAVAGVVLGLAGVAIQLIENVTD